MSNMNEKTYHNHCTNASTKMNSIGYKPMSKALQHTKSSESLGQVYHNFLLT